MMEGSARFRLFLGGWTMAGFVALRVGMRSGLVGRRGDGELLLEIGVATIVRWRLVGTLVSSTL
jgi:hypothetical protein